MKEDLTLITVVLDGSGSMESIKSGVISGFNELIAEQKKLPGEVVFNMIQFSSGWNGFSDNPSFEYKEIYSFRNLKEVSAMTDHSYIPNGGTPLIAAMCTAIDSVGAKLANIPEYARPAKVVFVTITDGAENTSDRKKFSKELLASKTKHQQDKYNWKFIYLGMHLEAFAEASSMGIMAKNTIQTEPTVEQFTRSLNTISCSIGNYRQTSAFNLEKDNAIQRS